MKSAAKKVARKMGKNDQKVVKKASKKAADLEKRAAKGTKKAQATLKGKGKEKVEKLVTQKDALIRKLKEELAEQGKIVKGSEKTLKEIADKARKEVDDLKKKMNQSILEVRGRAEAESKNIKEEWEEKGRALWGKVTELEEYKKTAQSKIIELQSKVREFAAGALSTAKEWRGRVTFQGNPLSLLGQEVKVGDKAPDFRLLDNALQPVTLESFKGKIKIISAVTSLDTPVCNMETRKFNEEAGKLPEKVAILTISMDLPFAQARWCAAAGVEKVKTYSDYRDRSFGLAYGVLIKEMNLLARAIFIVDEQNILRYVELVPEIAKEPDYDRVLSAVRALL